MKLPIILLSIFLWAEVTANQKVLIDENFLKNSLKENPPSLDQIDAALLGARLKESSIDDKFNTELSASASRLVTKEKQFQTFIPVTSPINNYEVKVSRSFTSGVSVGIRGFSEQFSNNFIQDATTTGLTVMLGVDLWKDLFGKKTSSQLLQAQSGTKQAKWQRDIAEKSFFNELRKIYWTLVANEEATKLTKELLKSSKKQVKQAKKRLKNNIADAGEVARYQSQVAARSASITSLQYEKESLVQSLKELLPHLSQQEISLKPYNLDNTVKNVLACTARIASEGQAPMQYTHYDEIVELLKEQESLEQRVNNSYDSIDVKLQTEFGYKGRDNSYSNSYSDLSDNGRQNYAVGLTLNVPLEKKKKTTREILEKASKKKYRAQRKREMGKIFAYHTQTVRQISLLQEIIRNQNANTGFLKKSLQSSQKKYNQARLDVQQLVNEQDAFLQSNLDEIRTKLTIINTILNYLSVYTEMPCPLNLL
jgi:outer membrane protein TolC